MAIDWVSTAISIAALAIALGGFLLMWRQLQVQDLQFAQQLDTQKRQFSEQLAAEGEKITRLEALVSQLQRQTKAQEDLARSTERQNDLLAQSTSVQREQLERDKRSWGRKLIDGFLGG